MKISDVIEERISNFISIYGYKPKGIHLGRDGYNELFSDISAPVEFSINPSGSFEAFGVNMDATFQEYKIIYSPMEAHISIGDLCKE